MYLITPLKFHTWQAKYCDLENQKALVKSINVHCGIFFLILSVTKKNINCTSFVPAPNSLGFKYFFRKWLIQEKKLFNFFASAGMIEIGR